MRGIGAGKLLSRVAAATRLRAARARLGGGRYALVYWVTVEDLSWQELARWVGVSDPTIRRAAAEAIERLAGD